MNIGDNVKLIDKNIYGKIIKITKNTVTILSNNKQIITGINNVILFAKPSNISRAKYYYDKKNISYEISSLPSNELMIRHQTSIEAMQNVEKFLDTALLYNLSFVKIIHGKHGGILKSELHKLLDSLTFVKSYNLGDYYNGQDGVTIVYLKQDRI